ncbi:DUF4339 domain-containing protein [Vallitalea guaymasensis]|uniref:DUF4339 domain-containing protein n=1 Tax=Vallitalea guaymasensis TaxID=1185412 RepID=UPI00272C51DC|nr:DUF4339 domain-containing protein [Vallitalea guaymasensis]
MNDIGWYLHNTVKQMGPFHIEDIIALINNKQIEINGTYVWKDGYEDWILLKDDKTFVDPIKNNYNEILDINSASYDELINVLKLDSESITNLITERIRNRFTDVYELTERIGLKPHQLNNIRKLDNITFGD